ncbi:MAG: NusA-like transcription termination signal-binding factor [Nanoarchaeota archaeon]
MSIKYTVETIQYRTVFENLTAAKVKDCFLNEKLIVIVKEGELGKVIGKHGKNIKRLEEIFKRKIRIIEFNSDLINFIRNLIYPIKARNISLENNCVIIAVDSIADKGRLIGRDSKNLNIIKDLVNKYFKVNDIKIV